MKSMYKDIKSELVIVSNDFVVIDYCHIENGQIIIQGGIKKGYSGDKSFPLISNKYSPRIKAYGYITLVSSGNDANKINEIVINKDGSFYVWVSSPLNYNVIFTIMYPLKNLQTPLTTLSSDMKELAKKSYVDSRTIFKSVGDLGVGAYLYKEIIGANVLIISFRNSDNSTDVITFITSSYAMSRTGCVVTVDFVTGMIIIDALASTFKFNSFSVLK